jgi:6-pyruvoyltetrahydropterin/6-carboxytetrahydropterin synthase
MLLGANPTAENIARLIFEHARQAGFPVVECRLWETPHCAAAYGPPGPEPGDLPYGEVCATGLAK